MLKRLTNHGVYIRVSNHEALTGTISIPSLHDEQFPERWDQVILKRGKC